MRQHDGDAMRCKTADDVYGTIHGTTRDANDTPRRVVFRVQCQTPLARSLRASTTRMTQLTPLTLPPTSA
jgi:hypothetical protein